MQHVGVTHVSTLCQPLCAKPLTVLRRSASHHASVVTIGRIDISGFVNVISRKSWNLEQGFAVMPDCVTLTHSRKLLRSLRLEPRPETNSGVRLAYCSTSHNRRQTHQ